MQRIIELMNYYREKGNGKISELVDGLGVILRSGNNEQAEEAAKNALPLLEEVAARKDHISKLKAFIFDLTNKKINVQPLM